MPNGYLDIWRAIARPAVGEALPRRIGVSEALKPVLRSKDVDVLYRRLLKPFNTARREKTAIGSVQRASILPKWDFINSSRKRTSFKIDVTAGAEDFRIDDMRIVIARPVIRVVSRIRFALVVISCQSKLKYVVPYLRWDSREKWTCFLRGCIAFDLARPDGLWRKEIFAQFLKPVER